MLMEDLRLAVEDGSLMLHYQPEVDLRTGDVVACEALLRWTHPRLGAVPPEQFLSLAEEFGLTRQITAWVLEQAIRDCAHWWKSGHQVAVSVNLLATDLLNEAMPEIVGHLLQNSALPPAALVLEITEQMLLPNMSHAMQVIDRLAEMDIVVSIDDFGTGFSSLARLSQLRAGELKLDRFFISRLLTDADVHRDMALIKSSIDLGHALGMRVVAEGIERVEIIELLVELGCDRGQGFAIHSPTPAHSLRFDAHVSRIPSPRPLRQTQS